MTTEEAREKWNDLLKELGDECGETDPNKAGARLMLRMADAVDKRDRRIMELEHLCKAIGAL